jgi:DNA mismatch repair ATPase MutL
MSADIEMEEQATTNSKPPSQKKSSKKRKSITTEAPDVENTTQPTEPTTTTPNKKKEKKKKGTTTTTDNEEAENESSKKKKPKQSTDAENDADQNINVDALSPIAHPLADKKLSKRVLRTVKKGVNLNLHECFIFYSHQTNLLIHFRSSSCEFRFLCRFKAETNQERCERSSESVEEGREGVSKT